MRTGARHLRQCLEGGVARLRVTLRCREGEREECWIVLRCAAGVRNLDDAADHTRAVRLDHAQEGLCVLERQLALANVERAALGTERNKPVESSPVVDLPGEAAGAVRHLIGAEDLLMLWRRAGLNPADVCNSRHVVFGHLHTVGSRNGTRPKPVQTAEGELSIDMPQVRGTAERFISRVFPDSRTVNRTRPLEALIIGGYVRGLSDRDIETFMREAGLGQVSKSTASRICRELRARYKAFCARSLADVELLARFLDAIYLPTRPSGEKEGVPVAWGYTTQGKRVLVGVRLGQRERHEDWLDLGRDLVRTRAAHALAGGL